ncbi:hypothetical protein ACQEUX_12600 [Micromonospora sp. CA-259024]|uniref:hypothetical protein n=1 Tax=Micromonospora sp. CA-259024 TaxID=3239965 RepID=UPI003D927792
MLEAVFELVRHGRRHVVLCSGEAGNPAALNSELILGRETQYPLMAAIRTWATVCW